MECGPAALATVALHHGLRVSVARLREAAGTDLQGTSLEQLRAVAEQFGFMAAGGRAKEGALETMPLPAIAHLNDPPRGHFVVVHKVEAAEVLVADPAVGVVRLPREEFMRRWSRAVLLLAPSPEFRPDGGRGGPLLQMARIALGHRRILILSLLCAAAMAVLGFGASFFVKAVLDRVIPSSDLPLLHLLGIGMIFVLVFRAFYEMCRHYLLAHAGLEIELELGRSFVKRLTSMPIRFFDARTIGDLGSRLGDATIVRGAISGSMLLAFVDILLLSGAVLLMVLYNPTLALVVLGVLPCVGLATLWLQTPIVRLQREARGMLAESYNRLLEAIANMRILRVFTAEAEAARRIDEPFLRLQERNLRRDLWTGALGVLSTFLTSAVAVLLLWVGAPGAAQGRISLGELMLFYSLLGLLLGPVQGLAISVTHLREAAVSMERLSEVRDARTEEPRGPGAIRPASIRGEIEFRGVSFEYRQGYPVLSGLDLRVEAGSALAVVGETGSGKTSMASLLMGFYPPHQGTLLIDGVDIRSYDPGGLRRHLAIVFQDPSLMGGTVRENIALGDLSASQERIEEAARQAGAHEFILQLPKQYDYEVGDRGVALSSGQRQRIAIARALLRDPAILVLDEATSNLDAKTEREVMDSILATRRGRTTLVITHRLANASLAHRVVLMERGRIAESGTHHELVRSGGLYAALWSRVVPPGADPLWGRMEWSRS
jgi:ATP-binding cassette subfamily B protein